MRKYALFSLKISNNHFTKILSQAILPKLFYNAAIWGHKAKSKANLQKNSTLINSAAHIATNLPRTTPLQILYQLTNIPSTKILLEREIALRLNTLLMQPHKTTHNLLRLHPLWPASRTVWSNPIDSTMTQLQRKYCKHLIQANCTMYTSKLILITLKMFNHKT